MTPISPVMPGSQGIEVVLGKNQPEYVPLPAVFLRRRDLPMIVRFELTDDERAAVAEGADIVLQQCTFGQAFQPVNLQVVMRDEYPQIVEEPGQ